MRTCSIGSEVSAEVLVIAARISSRLLDDFEYVGFDFR